MFPNKGLSLFGRPRSKDCLAAISKAVLRARSNHDLTNEQLANGLGCSTGTIKNALSESSMMRTDTLLRFGYFFPEEFAPIQALMSGAVPEAPTVADRLERIETHLDAIRREADETIGLRVAS
jgi:hypothetical protein